MMHRKAALSGEIILITPAGVQAVHDRLEALRAERAQLEYDLGYAAQDYPDLRENAIYGDISIKLQLDLPRQVDDLREVLARAQVVKRPAREKVDVGQAFVASIDDGEELAYWFTGPVEAKLLAAGSDKQVVSYLSPLGQAVWGAAVGDEVMFAGGGGERSVRIVGLALDDNEC